MDPPRKRPRSPSSREDVTGRPERKRVHEEFKYLSKFVDYVEETTFFPTPECQVRVRVSSTDVPLSPGGISCPECARILLSSQIPVLIRDFNWAEIVETDLRSVDRRLHGLATSILDATQRGLDSGLAKMVVFEMVSLARSLLCCEHSLRLSVSTPLRLEDYAGGIMTCRVSRATETKQPDSADTSAGSVAATGASASGATVVPGDKIVFRGAADVTVMVGQKPYVYMMAAELKKSAKWRSQPKKVTLPGGEMVNESQLGHLLYFLTGIQLNRLQRHLSREDHENIGERPSCILGMFLQEGMITLVKAHVELSSAESSSAAIMLEIGREEQLSGQSLNRVLTLLHTYFSIVDL